MTQQPTTWQSDDPSTEHERFRELTALALYDELDAAERDALERHLAACADCRALAAELQASLGRLASAPSADDLPPAWLGALRARIEHQGTRERGGRPRLPWTSFAAGLAAGVAASLLWIALTRSASSAIGTRHASSAPAASAPEPAARFARATPPPPTSSRGPFSQLALLRSGR